MKDREIYSRTLRFSLMKVLFSIIGVVCLVLLPCIGILVASGMGEDAMIIGGVVGLVLGIIACIVLGRFSSYLYQAGQIAMIAQAVDSGTLPDDAYAAGKQAVKKRFGTVAAYFGLMALIKGISSAITNAVNKVTEAIDKGSGNEVAGTIGGVISACIALVLEYVNYCSLGWVFIHRDESAFKSTCDGAVIYFQNWKTLLKNAGKIIGISALSLVVIGGAFLALFYALFGALPHLTSILADLDASMEWDEGTCLIAISAVAALAIWSGIHAAFVEPVILISVMRRYVEAGKANPPKVDVYGKLAGMSKHFKKAMDKAEKEGALPKGAGATA